MQTPTRVSLAVILVASTLAGCGGGGSSGPTPPEEAAPPAISSDASLAELRVSAATFDQVFQGTIYDYTGTASYLSDSTTVTATPSDPNAAFQVNGIDGSARVPSEPFDLVEGNNVITVTVTAEDGLSSQSYTIDISRAGAESLASRGYVKASNTGGSDWFGTHVAVDGDTMVVAASGEDSAATGVNADAFNDDASGSGAVFVFRRDAAGTWQQEAYIKASNSETFDEFASSIALSGNTLAVGAFREDSAAVGANGDQSSNSAIDAGAVYVFTRDDTGVWSQQAYLKASNTEAVDGFGIAVALHGDTLAVGAHLEDSSAVGANGDQADNGAPDAGAVYVFGRDAAGEWAQQAYLKASNAGRGDRFGGRLALFQDTLAVGAAHERSRATGVNGNQSNNSWSEAGAAYVFARTETGSWVQQAYLKASNTGNGDRFGDALALHGDTLVVGAPLEDSAARGIDGFEADNRALSSGAAYVFGRDVEGTWVQQAYVKASNTDSQDRFGHGLALHGDLMVVGAAEGSSSTGAGGDQADNSARSAGATYFFERDGSGAWSQTAYIKSSNTDAGDEFGSALATDGESMIVGARLEDSMATGIDGDQSDNTFSDSGAVYIIR